MNKEDWKYLKGEWKNMWNEFWYFFILFYGCVFLFIALLFFECVNEYRDAKMSEKPNGTEIVINPKE